MIWWWLINIWCKIFRAWNTLIVSFKKSFSEISQSLWGSRGYIVLYGSVFCTPFCMTYLIVLFFNVHVLYDVSHCIISQCFVHFLYDVALILYSFSVFCTPFCVVYMYQCVCVAGLVMWAGIRNQQRSLHSDGNYCGLSNISVYVFMSRLSRVCTFYLLAVVICSTGTRIVSI